MSAVAPPTSSSSAQAIQASLLRQLPQGGKRPRRRRRRLMTSKRSVQFAYDKHDCRICPFLGLVSLLPFPEPVLPPPPPQSVATRWPTAGATCCLYVREARHKLHWSIIDRPSSGLEALHFDFPLERLQSRGNPFLPYFFLFGNSEKRT